MAVGPGKGGGTTTASHTACQLAASAQVSPGSLCPQASYSHLAVSKVLPWQQETETTRLGEPSSSCTGRGLLASSSFLPRRPLALFPQV